MKGLSWANVIRVGVRLCVGLVEDVLEVSRGWRSYGVNRRLEESGHGEWLHYSLVVACGMNRKKTCERRFLVMMP